MAKKSISNDKVVLDHSFFIPDGVDDFIYEPDWSEDPEEEYLGWDSNSEEGDEVIDTPYTIVIISQTAHLSSDGVTQVVDVVIDVDDALNSDDYEVRIVKV